MNLTVPAVNRNNLRAAFILTCGALWGIAAVYAQNMMLWFPVLLLCIWCWVRVAKAHCSLATLIIIIFDEGLYRTTTFGLGPRIIGDVSLFLIFTVILVNANQIWRRLWNKLTFHMVAIWLFLFVIAVSLYFGSHIIFHQPFSFGLIPARKYLVLGIYFFLLGVGMTKYDIYLFFKYLAWWGGVLALLGIIDASIGGGVIFTEYHQIGNTREGATRLAVGTFNVCYSIIYSLVFITNTKASFRATAPYLLLLAGCLANLFFVSMTRAAIIGMACAVILLFLRSSLRTKILTLVGLGVIIPTLMFSAAILKNNQQFKQIIGISSSIVTDINRNEGNVSIRKQGATALLDAYWTNSPIVGIGIFSHNNFPNNPIAILSNVYNYHLVDVNGLATLIQFGIPGVTLLSMLILKTFYDTRHIEDLPCGNDKMLGQVLFLWLIYILCTPTLGNLLVEHMLVYTGIIFYTQDHLLNRHRVSNG